MLLISHGVVEVVQPAGNAPVFLSEVPVITEGVIG